MVMCFSCELRANKKQVKFISKLPWRGKGEETAIYLFLGVVGRKTDCRLRAVARRAKGIRQRRTRSRQSGFSTNGEGPDDAFFPPLWVLQWITIGIATVYISSIFISHG